MRDATAYVDGLCEPVNPMGIASYGFIIYSAKRKVVEGRGVVRAKYTSNNVAEYTACISALEKAKELGFKRILVCSDSQLLINQLNGNYSVRAEHLIPLYQKVQKLIESFEEAKFTWIPRSENREADLLSRIAYEEEVERMGVEEFRRRYGKFLATEKQIAYIRKLGSEPPKYISKVEASKLIDSLKPKEKPLDSFY
jgi:ribonuclease HI